MCQAIILSANQCPKQSIVSIVNLANSSLSVIWQALKVAVSYLDSPEGLPAKQAAFLSGLPSSDYLAASANTNALSSHPDPLQSRSVLGTPLVVLTGTIVFCNVPTCATKVLLWIRDAGAITNLLESIPEWAWIITLCVINDMQISSIDAWLLQPSTAVMNFTSQNNLCFDSQALFICLYIYLFI